jgi:hypothetical protein
MTRKNKVAITVEMIMWAVLVLAFAVMMVVGMEEGIRRQELIECEQWMEWERTVPGFCWTEWQIEQCVARGVLEDKKETRIDKDICGSIL